MKLWLAGGTSLLAIVAAAYSQAVTSDVLRAQVSIQGVIQFSIGTNQTIHSVRIDSADLVNLALGRVLGTDVPRNQVLAFGASPGTNNAKIFVYDSNTASNLATIGEIDPVEEVEQTGVLQPNTEQIAQLVIPPSGSISNGLTGGDLLLDGKSHLDTNSAVLGFSARLLGVLDTMFVGTFTNFSTSNNITMSMSKIITNVVIITNVCPSCITNIPVLVQSGTVNARGGKIGTLIEGP